MGISVITVMKKILISWYSWTYGLWIETHTLLNYTDYLKYVFIKYFSLGLSFYKPLNKQLDTDNKLIDMKEYCG